MPIPVIILQPPLVQLNGPYPSGAYLAAFFRGLAKDGWSQAGADSVWSPEVPAAGVSRAGDGLLPGGLAETPGPVKWIDTSNLLFRDIFSARGLTRLFDLTAVSAAERIERADREGDSETAFQLRRYRSLSTSWITWIDGIVSILQGGDRELCHAFVRSPHAPRGARMDRWFSELETDPTADDARLLATLAIEDLADYITAVYDSEFSLVRYAESIAVSEASFEHIEAGLERPIMKDFLEPMLERLWDELDGTVLQVDTDAAGAAQRSSQARDSDTSAGTDNKILFCISVPFPGCLVGGLSIARSIRARYGSRAVIALGGGYVNTELRDYGLDAAAVRGASGTVPGSSSDTPGLFRYIDQLSFDRGYGAYAHWFRQGCPAGVEPGYPVAAEPAAGVVHRVFCPDDLAAFERVVTASIIPDYSDLDLASYPRLADTANPMHRLWSDGAWLKAMLAHGCYWHRCSFCDVTLDYIKGYMPVDAGALHKGLLAQAEKTGVRGIHFVDEAAPPRGLRDFAECNIRAAAEGRRPLSFWGNIRFERTFTRDLAEYLCAGGLVAVSGGIEIASEEGFKAVDKGIDLENLVATCAAFKEAGVLVHSYLIYGYWNEDEQGVIDTAETMRQLFAAGLVDSAFWHKFVLTRHSRAYDEWKRGMHRDGPMPLEPRARGIKAVSGGALTGGKSDADPETRSAFANNDLSFRGEEASERYTAPLDEALHAWMSGEGLSRSVRKWFPYTMPAPRVAPDTIERYIASYERKRDAERSAPFDPKARYAWTASRPVPAESGAGSGRYNRDVRGSTGAGSGKREYIWRYLGDEVRYGLPEGVAELLMPGNTVSDRPGDSAQPGIHEEVLSRLSRKDFAFLRASGLVKISPLG